ncbi:MAG: glycosyltransferase family 2 protein, partial [Parvularcula sp.]|nr:glycosyltransferase family 2 protein [Parvularcula sp.]
MLLKAYRRLRGKGIDARLIAASGLFDPSYYRLVYGDIPPGTDPLRHYVEHGAAEGRDPSALFVTDYYLGQYPALDPKRINPLTHYIVVGEGEGARPNPYLDPLHVRRALRLAPQHSPLRAYMKLPHELLCDPSPEFDLAHYRRTLTDDAGNAHPLAFFLRGPIVAGAGFGGLQEAEDLTLEPVSDLEALGGGSYRALGHDPHFVLRRPAGKALPAGRYRLSFSFGNEAWRLATAAMFVDDGKGFRQETAFKPVFTKGEDGRLETLFELNETALALRLDPWEAPDDDGAEFHLDRVRIEPLRRGAYYLSMLRVTAQREGRVAVKKQLTAAAKEGGREAVRAELERIYRRGVSSYRADYQAYIDRFEAITDDDLQAMRRMLESFEFTPLISVVMPTYNTPADLLRRCLDSVLAQVYPHWELCIADDASPSPHVAEILEEYAQRDPRIRYMVRERNGHISNASNSAIELAQGEYMALLDHDDELPPHALFCVAHAINENPSAALLFSDEDKIDPQGDRLDPYFKTDYNERLTFAQNMVSHLGVYRLKEVREIGGFREGLEGSQDWDLMLRFVERIDPTQIVHLPFVLYHWRMLEGSTSVTVDNKNYAVTAGKRAVEEALKRRGIDAKVGRYEHLPHYKIEFALPDPLPKVAIIIPTRDGLEVLQPCLEGVLHQTSYGDFEVVIVDNGSEKEETLAYLRSVAQDPRVTVRRDEGAFNFARINNDAANGLDADFFCFLNNDTTIIHPDWLTELVREGVQPDVGVVGTKLLYPDETNQHAGVILGIGGEEVAGHAFTGLPGHEAGYFGRAELPHQCSAVTAACMLTKRSLFEELGGFDEQSFAVAFNDVDYCLRAGRAGQKVIFTPNARLIHHESKTRGVDAHGANQERYLKEAAAMKARWGDLLS